jgi:hypothetical protein
MLEQSQRCRLSMMAAGFFSKVIEVENEWWPRAREGGRQRS